MDIPEDNCIWPRNINTCDEWESHDFCIVSLKEDYVRHSCRVCAVANDCWPGLHEGSVHSMQSGQSAARDESKPL